MNWIILPPRCRFTYSAHANLWVDDWYVHVVHWASVDGLIINSLNHIKGTTGTPFGVWPVYTPDVLDCNPYGSQYLVFVLKYWVN